MAYGFFLRTAPLAAAILLNALPTQALAAEKARITGLSDVAFGQVYALSDISIAQDICVYSSSAGGAYSVIASGNGTGGAFQLSSGADSLAYQVQWAQMPSQASGSPLQAGVASQQFDSNATHQFCNSGPPTSATLIIQLGSGDAASARAGNYSGVLSITIVPG